MPTVIILFVIGTLLQWYSVHDGMQGRCSGLLTGAVLSWYFMAASMAMALGLGK